MKKLTLLSLLALPLLSGCSGIRQTGDTYSAHAESFHFFGLSIPGNEHEAAWEMVPEGATIHSATSTPLDWTSFFGVLNNILGISETRITWTSEEGPVDEAD